MLKNLYIPYLPDFLSLCERNYAALHRLLPATLQVGASSDIQCGVTTVYRLTVLEVAPFTTRLKIELQRSEQSDYQLFFFQPSFDVQLYHDARLAEVVRMQQQWRFAAVYPYPNATMSQPDEKRQINLLLRDWLKLCARAGYRAEPEVFR